MESDEVYNPLDKTNLGRSVVEALLKSKERELAGIKLPFGNFEGAGIYALYYRGDFKAYELLAVQNQESGTVPIYVGKAIPKGGRKGSQLATSAKSNALSKRLAEHASSIEAAESLKIEDFTYRRLVVDDIWISLGESIVIEQFKPLWNLVVEGFGNHNPGSGRFQGKRPLWDELHPGRSWAEKCVAPKLNREAILRKVELFMESLDAG